MRHVLAEGRYDAPIFTDINTRFCSQMQRMDGPKAGSITPFAPVSKFPDVPSSFNSLVDNWEVVTIYEVKVKISAKGKHRQEHTVTRWDAVTWLNISLIRSKRCERAEFFKVVARWKGVDMESKTSNVVCYSINRSEETARELSVPSAWTSAELAGCARIPITPPDIPNVDMKPMRCLAVINQRTICRKGQKALLETHASKLSGVLVF